jgi:drug/metabolite transporter (DMT)-like permease
VALLSAAAFGTSGTFATSLIDAGWSPAAAVTARLLVAAAILTGPAVYVMRGRWSAARPALPSVAGYGLVAVAVAQLCYFNAIEHVSIGIALLLEYLGTVLIVGWLWVRHGQRPRRLTVGGIGVVVVGLALVLDVTGHQHVDLVGVLWGLGAAVGLAAYYVLSARPHEAAPPIAMAWGGMTIGGVILLALGSVGALSMHASTADVDIAHHRTSWIVPVLSLALLATAFAYAVGIHAAQVLGAKIASFVGLSEVLFAALFAWLALGQGLHPGQLVGGGLVIAGVAIIRADEPDAPADPTAVGDQPIAVGPEQRA